MAHSSTPHFVIMKETQKNNQTVQQQQQQQQQQVLDTTEKCLKAASIDQSSLFNALSNLYQILSLHLENSSSDCSTCTSSNDHTNDNINNDRDGGDNVDTDAIKKEVEEDAYEIDKTKETKKGGINDITRTNHDTDTTDTDTRIDT